MREYLMNTASVLYIIYQNFMQIMKIKMQIFIMYLKR